MPPSGDDDEGDRGHGECADHEEARFAPETALAVGCVFTVSHHRSTLFCRRGSAHHASRVSTVTP